MGSCRAAATIVLVALVAPAVAQPPKPTDAQRQQAGDLVKQAITKSQAGDHQSAIELYQNAYDLVPIPILLSNIGTEYQQLHKLYDARKYFCRYLEREPNGDGAGYATAQAKVIAIELGQKDVDDATVCNPPPKPEPPPPPKSVTSQPPATSVVVTTDERPRPNRGLQIGGATVATAGGVALAFGIYYGIHAKNISDFITSYPTTKAWPADINSLEQTGRSAQTAQIVLDIIGPVAIVGE
jgi:hypothetical protein